MFTSGCGPGGSSDFLAATLVNAQASLAEPGVLRFDVIQDQADPEHVVLVEVYRDDDASAAHKLTPHYAVWRDSVAEMMAEPRASTRYSAVFPDRRRGLGRAARRDRRGFEFATAGRIMVGQGRAAELPERAGRARVPGAGVHRREPGAPRRAAGRAGAAGRGVSVAGEPTVDLARAGAAAAREHGADVVAAIGGGSVIDTGKAVAMLLGNGGDPLDYLEVVGAGQKITRPAAPCVAVPTTAGTGAEVTANAVLAAPEHRLKASLRSPLMIPAGRAGRSRAHRVLPAAGHRGQRHGRADPVPGTVRLGPGQPADRRPGPRGAAPRRGRACAPRTPTARDLAARADMAVCSLLGGMALANAKLGAVHGLAGVIGGTAPVPHGVGLRRAAGPGHRGQRARAAVRAAGRPARPGPVRRDRPGC